MTALGSHLVWAAIAGAAAVIVKETKHFEWANIIDKRFIFFFCSSDITRNMGYGNNTLSSGYLKYILLIMIAWLFIFILMKAGLTQVNQLRDEYNRLEER